MGRTVEDKRRREQEVVAHMIGVYCRGVHHTRGEDLCPQCRALLDYAVQRSQRFMAEKTFCSNCRVHCYRPEMREEVRRVMRYAGPRMLLSHPVMAIRHVIESNREKRRLKKECAV